MFGDLYQNIVLKKPKLVFTSLLIVLISFGYFSKDFRLDASSDTLLIEGDPDLEYLREINQRYGAKDFLVLTHTPNPMTFLNDLCSRPKSNKPVMILTVGHASEEAAIPKVAKMKKDITEILSILK